MTQRKTRWSHTVPPRRRADGKPSVVESDGHAAAQGTSGVDAPPLQVAADTVVLPGKLGRHSTGSLRLHTREALRVFSGRAANTKARIESLPGGRHYAAALKAIWYQTGDDNPYADWLLIRAYDGLLSLRERLADLTAAREATLTELRHKGLALDVLASARPVTVALGFRSPYGFAIAETLAEFDYYVRLVQTLVRMDRLSEAEGATDIQGLSQSLFGLYRKGAHWERLLRGDLRYLRRDDFRPDAGAEAQQRVAAATAQLGALPREILLGIVQPRHSRRPVNLAFAAAVSTAEAGAAEVTESSGQAVARAGDAAVALQVSPAGVAADVSRETLDAGAPDAPAGQ